MKAVLLALVLAYLAYGVAMIALHPRFIYPFQPDDRVLDGFRRIELTAGDGTAIYVQERPGPGPVALYFMGNAGALPYFGSAFDRHAAAGRHVVALEYRGGGGRPGRPGEAALKADALVAADHALDLGKPVVVEGYSLGAGLALHVAARRKVAAVILTAPYDRLCRVMTAASGLPACWLPRVQRWEAIRDAGALEAPVLILHGTDDDVIAPAFSKAFLQFENVRRRLIEGAGHADIDAFPDYNIEIEDFLAGLGM